MNGLPWYKCYPRDFNDGLIGLTLEERGAYTTILNVIYARGGPVPDEAGYFRALLCCSAKTWVKVRAALIVKRKLFEVNFNGEPCLMNRRAADEIAESEEKSQKFSDAGRRGGQTTQAKAKENNGSGEARLKAGSSDTDTEAEQIEGAKAPAASAGPKADDVRVAFDEWNALAAKLGLPQARKLDATRRKAIRSRLADGGLGVWRLALAAVEASKHCRGENDRQWRADLDFVCTASKYRRLVEGAYGPVPKAVGGQPATPKFPDAEVRAKVLEERDEAWCASWLDPCAWDAEARAIIPRTNFAAAKLKQEVGHVLRELGVRVEERAAA